MRLWRNFSTRLISTVISNCGQTGETENYSTCQQLLHSQPNKPVPPNGGNGLSRLEWVDTPNSSIHPLSLITKSARENMHVGVMHAHAHRSTHLRVLSLDWLWINEASFQLPKAAPELTGAVWCSALQPLKRATTLTKLCLRKGKWKQLSADWTSLTSSKWQVY